MKTLKENVPAKKLDDWDQLYSAPKNINELQDSLEAKIISRQMESMPPTLKELDEELSENSLELRLDKLTKNVTTLENPSAEALRAYFKLHQEEYREASKITLEQVAYAINIRGGDSASDARKALSHSDKDIPQGDDIPIPRHFTDVSSLQLDEIFGERASLAIINLARHSTELPCWGGPLTSVYGVHLVCIKEFTLGKMPPFSEVRLQVLNDWRYETAAEKDQN